MSTCLNLKLQLEKNDGSHKQENEETNNIGILFDEDILYKFKYFSALICFSRIFFIQLDFSIHKLSLLLLLI